MIKLGNKLKTVLVRMFPHGLRWSDQLFQSSKPNPKLGLRYIEKFNWWKWFFPTIWSEYKLYKTRALLFWDHEHAQVNIVVDAIYIQGQTSEVEQRLKCPLLILPYAAYS